MSAAHAPAPVDRLESTIRARSETGAPALIAYLTAGFPSKERFPSLLREVAGAADAVEVGVPFSDPMADGATIQEASRVALGQGVSLAWILESLASMEGDAPAAPLVLMSYLNPIMRFGCERFAAAAGAAGVSAAIVPDLPLEESRGLRAAMASRGLGLVQMVTPVSPPDRVRALGEASRGFLYAVTVAGTTGGRSASAADLGPYLDGLRAVSRAPVCAGFGIRSREQVEALRGHADGVIVGSALIEAIGAGRSAAELLASLRPTG